MTTNTTTNTNNDTALHERNDRTEALTMLQCATVAEWYEQLAPHLVKWLYARSPLSASLADDIVQDTFIRICSHVAHLSTLTETHRRNYVFSIAAHLLADRARTDDRHNRMSGGAAMPRLLSAVSDAASIGAEPVTASHDWTANAQQMEQTTEARLTLVALWRATPVEQRELLLMVAQGYSYGEMCAHFDIKYDNLRIRIHRLRVYLRTVGERVA